MNREIANPAADAVATQRQRAELVMRINKIVEEAPVAPMHGDAELLTPHSSRGKEHRMSTPDQSAKRLRPHDL